MNKFIMFDDCRLTDGVLQGLFLSQHAEDNVIQKVLNEMKPSLLVIFLFTSLFHANIAAIRKSIALQFPKCNYHSEPVYLT